jgi:hypothetical protein
MRVFFFFFFVIRLMADFSSLFWWLKHNTNSNINLCREVLSIDMSVSYVQDNIHES